MKSTIYILVSLLFLSSLTIAQNTEEGMHPIVLKAKETSLYTERVNWQEVNSEFVSLIKDTTDLKQGLQYLINSLGDKHGMVRLAKDYSPVVWFTGGIEEQDNRDPDFINTVINDVSVQFSYRWFGNEIGYLKLVAIGAGDVKDQADLIRAGLLELKGKGVNKWILDLRFNGGGNIEPMMAGLAPLVGSGFVGGAINNRGEIREYKIENGQFFNYGRLVCEMDSLPEFSQIDKVVVLISRYTISSGEMVAVSFKGRKNTRFIGEETAGYTTGNGYDAITNELMLVVSQDVFMDRNKAVYENRVGVDEKIEFEHGVDLNSDSQVKRATEWLSK